MNASPRLLLAALLILSACDLSREEERGIVITGRAVVAGTGEPIPGLGVVLRNTGGFGSSVFVAARTETASDGSFRLELPDPDQEAFIFELNDDPYNGCYGSHTEHPFVGDRLELGTVELAYRPEGQICNE